jgi:predicted nucleic acid-binding protein
MSVFIDTSAFLAVLNADDSHHRKAAATWKTIVENGTPLFTHNYVVLETFAVLQNRIGVEAARGFIEDIVPVMQVEWVTEVDHGQGITAVLTAARRQLSLTDCVSFSIMRRLGLRKVFCFDKHFQEQGFEMA